MERQEVLVFVIALMFGCLIIAVAVVSKFDSIIDGSTPFTGDVNMSGNYLLYMPLETSLTHAVGPGAVDVELLAIPAGIHTQDVHFWMFMISLDNPPGDGKTFTASVSDGTNTISCSVSGAVDKMANSTIGAFDLDVSVETLTITYSQTAGGATTETHTMRHWWYKENS